MSDYRSPAGVDSRIFVQPILEVINCVCHIQESARPATTRITNPSVLDTASDYSVRRELGAKVTDMVQIIGRQPPAAMNDEEEWERPFSTGKT
jgi:hypothetical protein